MCQLPRIRLASSWDPRWALGRGGLVLGCVVVSSIWGFVAPSPARTPPPPASSPAKHSAANPATTDSLVMTVTGDVLQGTVTAQGDYIAVFVGDGAVAGECGDGGGEVRLPRQRVAGIASNWTELYKMRRAQVTLDSLASQCECAEWCLRHGLLSEAANHVTLAVAIEQSPSRRSDRTAAERIRSSRIANLERRIQEATESCHSQECVVATAAVVDEPGRSDARPSESLAAYAPAVLKEFSTSIQPLLLNSCGNAHCHGTRRTGGPLHDSQFQLFTQFGNHPSGRRQTLENLHTVHQYLDDASPSDSPILVWALRPHPVTGKGAGNAKSAPFDQAQWLRLANWVELAVGSRSSSAQESTEERATEGLPHVDPFDPATFNALGTK